MEAIERVAVNEQTGEPIGTYRMKMNAPLSMTVWGGAEFIEGVAKHVPARTVARVFAAFGTSIVECKRDDVAEEEVVIADELTLEVLTKAQLGGLLNLDEADIKKARKSELLATVEAEMKKGGWTVAEILSFVNGRPGEPDGEPSGEPSGEPDAPADSGVPGPAGDVPPVAGDVPPVDAPPDPSSAPTEPAPPEPDSGDDIAKVVG